MTELEKFNETIAALENGSIRVAEKKDGRWQVNSWVKEVVFVFKEELRHIEGVAHHDLLAGYAHHALWRGLQVLKRIFHEVELRKWAWNGCARVARQSAVRVFDLANVVVAIWFHCNPVFRTGLGGLVVV